MKIKRIINIEDKAKRTSALKKAYNYLKSKKHQKRSLVQMKYIEYHLRGLKNE